jgi:hypothetical protein
VGAGDVIALVACIATVASVFLTRSKDRGDARRAQAAAAAEQERRIAILETKMSVLWNGVSADLAAILHHPLPQYAERDRLLERFLDGDITPEELDRLRELLREAVGDIHTQTPTSGERVAASILLRMLEAEKEAEPPQGQDE